jgi:hypothetical protein
MFIVYGQRFHAHDPFILEKDVNGIGKAGDVIDDGQPVKIRLSAWQDEAVAKHFAENVKNSVPKRTWKIFVE